MEVNRPTYYVCGACLGERHEDCASIYEPGTCACACRCTAEGTSRRADKEGRGRLQLVVSPGQDSHGQRFDEGAAERFVKPISSSWPPLLGP